MLPCWVTVTDYGFTEDYKYSWKYMLFNGEGFYLYHGLKLKLACDEFSSPDAKLIDPLHNLGHH